MCGFFLINIELALCIPGFHICGFNQPRTENSILCKNFYAILHKGLEDLQILVSKWGLGTGLLWIKRDDCITHTLTTRKKYIKNHD